MARSRNTDGGCCLARLHVNEGGTSQREREMRRGASCGGMDRGSGPTPPTHTCSVPLVPYQHFHPGGLARRLTGLLQPSPRTCPSPNLASTNGRFDSIGALAAGKDGERGRVKREVICTYRGREATARKSAATVRDDDGKARQAG